MEESINPTGDYAPAGEQEKEEQVVFPRPPNKEWMRREATGTDKAQK
jgi:hypothetical protein